MASKAMNSEFEKTDLLLPLPPQIPEHHGRMTIVLDMDETLIHSIFLSEMGQLLSSNLLEKKKKNWKKVKRSLEKLVKTADLFLQQKNSGDIAVFFRPGVHRFLYKLSKKFEVVLWTAADRSYAKPILEFLDPTGVLLPYRLFREHTVKKGKINCAKDLELLGRDMQKVMLIDNSLTAVETSPKNCYLIKDYYGNPSDQELQKAWLFINEICHLPDIRQHLTMMMKSAKPDKDKKKRKQPLDIQKYDKTCYQNSNKNYDDKNYDDKNYDDKNYDDKNYDDKNYYAQNTNNCVIQNNQIDNNNNQQANKEKSKQESWDYSYYYWSVEKKRKAFVWKTKQ